MTRDRYPRLHTIYADSIYHRENLYDAIKSQSSIAWQLSIVSRPANQRGWTLLPKRWVVERTFAWLGRSRILSKEYERLVSSSVSQLYISLIARMLKILFCISDKQKFNYEKPRK
jgi:putative transposase